MKKLIALLCALLMVVSLAACGAKTEEPAAEEPAAEEPAEEPAAEEPAAEEPAEEPAEEAASYVVGICQLAPHPALDAATQGFKDALTEALGDAVTFE